MDETRPAGHALVVTSWPEAYAGLDVMPSVGGAGGELVLRAERDGKLVGAQVGVSVAECLRDALGIAGPVAVCVPAAGHGETGGRVWVRFRAGRAAHVAVEMGRPSQPRVPAVIHCRVDRQELFVAVDAALGELGG